jgi:hypothetical protein
MGKRDAPYDSGLPKPIKRFRPGAPGGPNIASEYIDMGYNLLNIGSDVIGLTNYAEELINTFDKINS